MRGSLKAYKSVIVDAQLGEATPHRVVQMLMAGLIERLVQGKTAMELDNMPSKGERLSKAMNILISLRSSLSMDDGGDIAQNLDQLYEYAIHQVSMANQTNQPEFVEEVIDIIKEIKSAWDQIPPEFHNLTADKLGHTFK